MTAKKRSIIVATSVLIVIGDSEGSDYMVVVIIDKGSTSSLSVPDPDVNRDQYHPGRQLRCVHIF